MALEFQNKGPETCSCEQGYAAHLCPIVMQIIINWVNWESIDAGLRENKPSIVVCVSARRLPH